MLLKLEELFLTGKYNPSRTIALVGSEVKDAQYYTVIEGAPVAQCC